MHAQFLGGANLLTGHTDAHWRAVRKGSVPAFSTSNVRYAQSWKHANLDYEMFMPHSLTYELRMSDTGSCSAAAAACT